VESIMAGRDPPLDRPPSPARAWRAVLLFLGGSLVVLAILEGARLLSRNTPLARRPVSDRLTAAAYTGSESCKDCHPGQFAAHSRSGHARTLRPAERTSQAHALDRRTFADPEYPRVTWSYTLGQDGLSTERRGAGKAERFLIDYAFGSGHHATTFVTLTDRTPEHPALIEQRLTVFAHKELPDITPGQAAGGKPRGLSPSGRHYGAPETLKCFECHTTITSDRGPLALDPATWIPNIGCERCHGPGRAHIEAVGRGDPDAPLVLAFGPARWSTVDEMRMCGSCHRLPEMGEPALLAADSPVLARFQPVRLMQSVCYQESRGALSCVTCHDPHARTSTDVTGYEAVCRSCHHAPSQTRCKVSPETGCVQCHMPRRDVSRGMLMTDHLIRSWSRPIAGAPSSDRGQSRARP
jgi:hypothetical protein